MVDAGDGEERMGGWEDGKVKAETGLRTGDLAGGENEFLSTLM